MNSYQDNVNGWTHCYYKQQVISHVKHINNGSSVISVNYVAKQSYYKLEIILDRILNINCEAILKPGARRPAAGTRLVS